MKPTAEQEQAIEFALSGKSLALEALAGTGKSATLKMIAKAMPASSRILYTAFSAQVVADAKAGGFPPNVDVRSNHSLAYRAFGAAYRNAGRMERRLTPRVVAEFMGLRTGMFPGGIRGDEGAYFALEAVNRFQQGAAKELTQGHVKLPAGIKEDRAAIEAEVLKVARKLWERLADLGDTIPVSHDTYLKKWALTDPVLPYTVCMVDEAQDANKVVIDLLQKQSAQLIVVGDRRQGIFGFRGAVNALSTFSVDNRAMLTQSFRFGHAVAQAANAVLAAQARSGVTVKGTPSIESRIGRFDRKAGQYTVVARKNASLIEQLVTFKGRVGVVGGVSDLRRLVEGAEKLIGGEKALLCPDLMDFATWDEVKQYAETESGRDLSVLVKLVESYGTYRLNQLLVSVEGNERNEASCDLLLSTAHRAKGREWDRVVILDDFPVPTDDDITGNTADGADRTHWTIEEANLLYVAVTRAKKVLDVEECEAWMDAVDRCVADGPELPGLTDDPRFNPDAPQQSAFAAALTGAGVADEAPESLDNEAVQDVLLRGLGALYLALDGKMDRHLAMTEAARTCHVLGLRLPERPEELPVV